MRSRARAPQRTAPASVFFGVGVGIADLVGLVESCPAGVVLALLVVPALDELLDVPVLAPVATVPLAVSSGRPTSDCATPRSNVSLCAAGLTSAHAGTAVALIGGDVLLVEALRLAMTCTPDPGRAALVAAVVLDAATASAASSRPSAPAPPAKPGPTSPITAPPGRPSASAMPS